MNVVSKRKIINITLDMLSICAALTAWFCVFLRLKSVKSPKDEFNILALKSIFPRQKSYSVYPLKLNLFNNSEDNKNVVQNNSANDHEEFWRAEKSDMELPEFDNSGIQDEERGEGPIHKIVESQIGAGGIRCGDFYVKNSTGENINFEAEVNQMPEINIRNTDEPQVLVFHTHTSESYMSRDEGFFYDNFYPRSLDSSKNVTRVGQAVVDKLKEHGINAIHDETYHDNPTYNGSYSRSAETIKKNLSAYPSIQVVIDIHRDSLGSNETGKIKPTFKYNDKKAAQMMIISGCDSDGSLGFPNWRKNLKLALRLQKYCENMFPGITRPLNFAKVKYNEHLTPGSLLVEVGSDANTLEEAVYTGSMLGESLAKMLTDLKK